MYDRDALLAAVDLRALADELLGAGVGTGRSRMWPCPNPNHAQTGHTPPVSIFTSRRGEQRWRCHGCGDGGTAIDLVIASHAATAREAIAYLAADVGLREQSDDWRPTPPRQRVDVRAPTGCRDPDGLDRYVSECAERLWHPEGRAQRLWLIETRAIPPAVLVTNRIGADVGPRHQVRPDGMPRMSGVVLPVIQDGRAVYAQLRLPGTASDRPRYLNPAGDLAANPRLSRARPVAVRHPEVVVTEGAIDALSAAAAGYRAVAVLSAAYGDESVAVALAKLPHPLVVAFDADDTGRNAADRLTSLLAARQHPSAVIDLEGGDLNDAMMRCEDWPERMQSLVRGATASSAASRSGALSR
jgi:hypothetical protein